MHSRKTTLSLLLLICVQACLKQCRNSTSNPEQNVFEVFSELFGTIPAWSSLLNPADSIKLLCPVSGKY